MNNKTILEEIETDIRKDFNGDIRKSKKILFNFFRLKYLNNKNRDYIGYLVNRAKKNDKYIQSLEISEVGTLNKAGIFKEVKNINYDDYYFELLNQFYSETVLKSQFEAIINQNKIPCLPNSSTEDMFLLIKDFNKDLFDEKFHFRFFQLSDKYTSRETELWEALKNNFSISLNYELVRKL